MYQVKESGLGKKVCNADGITILSLSLSQRKLKRLFTLNCEFIEYAEQFKEGKASKSKQSTNESKYPKGGKQEESTKNNGTITKRRKRNSREGAE